MTAAAASRECRTLGNVQFVGKGSVAAATYLKGGTMVAYNAARDIVPASTAAAITAPIGVVLQDYDNSAGAAGAIDAEFYEGVFGLENDGDDTIVKASIGLMAYVHDDQTVALQDAAGAKAAGPIIDFDSTDDLVYVYVGNPLIVAGAAQALAEGSVAETVTTGALSLTTLISKLSITGTVGFTLADGLFIGQRKKMVVIVAATSPDGTLVPANFNDDTNIDFDAVGESAELVWDGATWHLASLSGTLTA